jgi:hypothetical protein
VKIAFRIGREDAEIFARTLGSVQPTRTKDEGSEALIPEELDRKALRGFLELPAQWEEWVSTLTDLPPRHALVKVSTKKSVHIQTLKVPSPKNLDPEALERVKREYRLSLMRPQPDIELIHQQTQATVRSTQKVSYIRD